MNYIDRLCDDILSEIFLVCVASYGSNHLAYKDDEMTNLTSMDLMMNIYARVPSIKLPQNLTFVTPVPNNVPFYFLQVNKRWRRVATNTRTLWNRVSVMPHYTKAGKPTRALFIKNWLELSGDKTPLSFHIAPCDVSTLYEGHWNESPEAREERATLGIFLDYAERCKALSIQFNKGLYHKFQDFLYPDSIQQQKRTVFTHLETLEINTMFMPAAFELRGWINLFPSLKHLHIIQSRSPFDIREVPFSSLESIYLHYHLCIPLSVQILAKCVSAKKITWAKIERDFEDFPYTQQYPVLPVPVELPNLKKLFIPECPQPGPCVAILSSFTMANLRDLELHWTYTPPYNLPDVERDSVLLINFLTRSGCHLDRLVLGDEHIELEELGAILSNPIVLRIPEVSIKYSAQWMCQMPPPGWFPELCEKSFVFRRFACKQREFFRSHGITIFVWATFSPTNAYPDHPYGYWELLGWNKIYDIKTQWALWKDAKSTPNGLINFGYF